MNAKEKTLNDISRIREVQHMLRFLLEDRLKNQIITE